MGYKKYHDLEEYANLFASHNMEDRARKLINFANEFYIDRMSSVEPMTGKERKITVGKIFGKCVMERKHRECEKRAHELLFQNHIIARSKPLHTSYNTMFCENSPSTIIDIIYSWNEFVYYIQTNDLIIDIYDDPKLMWWHTIDAKTLVMIHRKSPEEAYLENEIIRYHNHKDGTLNRYRVEITAVAERTPGTFRLGRTNIINLPSLDGYNSMDFERPVLT